MTRIPCTKCGTPVLEVTAKVNSGLCGPCARGAGFCVVCGKRVWKKTSSGEFIHMDCAFKQTDAAVAASSGISWRTAEDIDWNILQTGILEATRSAFQRIAAAHPNREMQKVELFYHIDQGVKVEPRVTFADEIEPNLFDDQILWKDLEPFYYAMTRIEESIENDEQSERFIEIVEANAHTMMNAVFSTLEREDFGLRLANKCTKRLKNF